MERYTIAVSVLVMVTGSIAISIRLNIGWGTARAVLTHGLAPGIVVAVERTVGSQGGISHRPIYGFVPRGRDAPGRFNAWITANLRNLFSTGERPTSRCSGPRLQVAGDRPRPARRAPLAAMTATCVLWTWTPTCLSCSAQGETPCPCEPSRRSQCPSWHPPRTRGPATDRRRSNASS